MNNLARSLTAFVAMASFAPAQAVTYNGIDFPQGAVSFADALVTFTAGPGPDAAFLDANQALGIPDVTLATGQACFLTPTPDNCNFTSLGNGGSLAVQFTDNVLTGSSASGSVTGVGDGFFDLYVVEVGVSEATSVEISQDGTNWIAVGDIGGGGGSSLGVFNYSFDLDLLGYGITDQFTYVRVLDSPVDVNTSPEGADIDAIGAIQSVPLPASVWLLGTGLAVLVGRSRRWRWPD